MGFFINNENDNILTYVICRTIELIHNAMLFFIYEIVVIMLGRKKIVRERKLDWKEENVDIYSLQLYVPMH